MDSPVEISVNVRVKNPSVSTSQTTPLKIQIYQTENDYSEQLIAQDVENAFVAIENYNSGFQPAPPNYFPTYSNLVASDPCKEANPSCEATFTFSIYPTQTIPKLGFIQVTVPDEFKVGVAGGSAVTVTNPGTGVAVPATFAETL